MHKKIKVLTMIDVLWFAKCEDPYADTVRQVSWKQKASIIYNSDVQKNKNNNLNVGNKWLVK